MSDLSFFSPATYMIKDVAEYGVLRHDILLRWIDLQALIQKCPDGLSQHLETALLTFSSSYISTLTAYATLGCIGGSCRYVEYLKKIQREYKEAVDIDAYDAKNTAQPNTPRTDTLLSSYAEAIKLLPQHLEAWRKNPSNTSATSSAYDLYTAWQLLNISYFQTTFGKDLSLDSMQIVFSCLSNLITEFPFLRKKGSASLNLSSPENISRITEIQKLFTPEVFKNIHRRDEVLRRLNEILRIFADNIEETILALRENSALPNFKPELIRAFIVKMQDVINQARIFRTEQKPEAEKAIIYCVNK